MFRLAVLFYIALVIAMPFAFIWSVNTLFGLTIGYGFTQWLAAFLLVDT